MSVMDFWPYIVMLVMGGGGVLYYRGFLPFSAGMMNRGFKKKEGKLRVAQWMPLDGRRSLVQVESGDKSYLILLGVQGELLLDTTERSSRQVLRETFSKSNESLP